MVLDRLSSLADLEIGDIEFSPTLSLVNIQGGEKVTQQGDTVQVDLGELSERQLGELEDQIIEEYVETGRILREDAAEEANVIEQGHDKKEDVLEYWEPILDDRLYRILELSLHLRAVIENKGLSKNEIDKRKGDIAVKYGTEAYYISNLCTAGYFDQDGGLADILVDIGTSEAFDRHHFRSILELIVDKKLLCVFVESDDSVHEVVTEVRGRIATYQQVDPPHDWIDIRGIGPECGRTIDAVVDELDNRYIGFDSDDWTEGDKKIVRFYPDTLPPMPGT